MATSGSYAYSVTALSLITEALELIGVVGIGESIEASESLSDLRTLNLLLKTLQSKMGMWLLRELWLFPANAQIKYDIGPTGDHCSIGAVKTELGAAGVATDTTVTIDATTNFVDTFDRNGIVTATTPTGAGAMTLNGALVASGIVTLSGQRNVLVYSDGDDSGVTFSIVGTNADGVAVTEVLTGPNTTTVYSASTYKEVTSVTISGAGTGNIEVGQVGDHVGIELDDNTLQWTYISGALSTTLPLVTALTGAAAIDNHVYSYTVKTPRPTELVECRLHKADDNDVPLRIMGRLDYEWLANKTQTGIINQVYYDKQRTEGELSVWLAPTNMQEYMKLTVRLPLQEITSLTETLDIGQEFLLPIAWTLAILLAPKHEKPIDPGMAATAKVMMDEAMASDSEDTSVTIRIGGRRGRRG